MNEVRYAVAAVTDVGLVRSLNEDAYLERPDLGLWVVADGMGGHESGDLASRTIVEELARVRRPASAPALVAEVKAAVARANAALRQEALARGPEAVIASTVVGLLVIEGFFACFWAGDSRLYLLRAGRMSQVTRDHSLVQELVDEGVITEEEAQRHPRANVITRAVGGADELDLEFRQGRLFANDTFLLCSDGLTRPVPDPSIARLLGTLPVVQSARALVDAAIESGGPDNVTVVVVKSLP